MKTYEYNGIVYSFNRSSRKWTFKFDSTTLCVPAPGGKDTADMIAKQINGALKRTKNGALDNLARRNIYALAEV